MTAFDFCIIYGAGFILNSLLATHYMRNRVDPEHFVSPILVMAFVFLSFAAWPILMLAALFKKGGGDGEV